MRTALLTACFLFSVIFISAQTTDLIRFRGPEFPEFVQKTQFKYPAFTRANILFKNGETGSARINYNNFRNVAKYIDGEGKQLDVANPEDILWLATESDTIFCDNGYIHWMASSGVARLGYKRDYKLVGRTPIGAFGTASPAKNVFGVNTMITATDTYNFTSNEEVTVSQVTTYFISPVKGKKHEFVPVTKKNLSKLFPSKDVEQFINDKKINLNKEQDLVDLLIYLSK